MPLFPYSTLSLLLLLVGEGWMVFWLLALPEVLWNRRLTPLCFIGAKSPGESEFVSHISRKDYSSKVAMGP